MLFPPRSVGSALGGLKKKFDLISLKKNPNPPWLKDESVMKMKSNSGK